MSLPEVPNTVRWYHHLLAAPLRLMTTFNLGPLGGENSISAVIEAVLVSKSGKNIDFELSKTDRFFVKQLTRDSIPEPMIVYRELNHAAQEEFLRRWGNQILGVIWLGAGVFTLEHPLLAKRKPNDYHLWTDAHPKVVKSAQSIFDEMRQPGEAVNLSYDITLPQDKYKLNRCIHLLESLKVQHILFNCYGLNYALTMQENYDWLSQLQLSEGHSTSFIFNAPGPSLPLLPGVMAAAHKQRMIAYERHHIEALFQETVPGSEIVWSIPRTETRTNDWEVWLIHANRTKAEN